MNNPTSHIERVATMGKAPVGRAPDVSPVVSKPIAGADVESIGNRGPPAWDEQLISIRKMRPMIGDPAISTIYDWVAKGKLDKPVKISENRVAWKLSSIRKFIAEKIQAAGEAA